jgi:hypothetical protein
MPTPLIPTEAISALLGALAGGFITYRFSLALSEKQFEQLREISKLDARYAASARFREAFANELVALESDDLGHYDVTDFLKAAYVKHAKAVVEFQLAINQSEREKLQNDWDRFRYGENEDGRVCTPEISEGLDHNDLLYLCYGGLGCTFETHIKLGAHQKAINRINQLLKNTECT